MDPAAQKLERFCQVAANQVPCPDDLAVARMWNGIGATKSEEPPTPRQPRRRWIVAAGAAALCAVVTLVMVQRGRSTVSRSVSIESSHDARRGDSGGDPNTAARATSRPHTWDLRAGETLTAQVSQVGTLTAIGPMTLELQRDIRGRHVLHQRGGRLVVDCVTKSAPACSRQLTVVAGGVRFLGASAAFSVDDSDRVRIAVLRGNVAASVEGTGVETVVDAMNTWQLGDASARPASARELRPLLLRGEARAPTRKRHAHKRKSPRGKLAPNAPGKRRGAPKPLPVTTMYQRAEHNLRDGKDAAAKRWLERIAKRCPAPLEACDAFYDLARLEFRNGNRAAAEHHLTQLDKVPISTTLRAAVASLRARLAR